MKDRNRLKEVEKEKRRQELDSSASEWGSVVGSSEQGN
jgi:hypothetical protein